MAYEFRRKDKSVQHGVRRIALEQIDSALAEIDDPQMDPDEKIHQLRKHAKKLRGLVRLVRPVFPGYAVENAAIRDAARQLSGQRDLEGRLETFGKLMAGRAGADRFAPVRAFLSSAKDQVSAQDLQPVRAELIRVRDRAEGWTLEAKGFGAMKDGLTLTRKRAARAMADFAQDSSDTNVHEWRKRVKYNWYHTRLLAPTRPGTLRDRARAARDLSELLGDHHDLSVLRDFLQGQDALPGDPAMWNDFDALIAERQKLLQDQALALGQDLYSGKAKTQVKRLGHWWAKWKGGKAD
ncbi:CHAD domain-containing protein [Actibacterium sp. D379-3]